MRWGVCCALALAVGASIPLELWWLVAVGTAAYFVVLFVPVPHRRYQIGVWVMDREQFDEEQRRHGPLTPDRRPWTWRRRS